MAKNKTEDENEFNFDFEELLAGLSEMLVPKSSITSDVKTAIEKIAFLYSYSPADMQKVVLLAIDEEAKLSDERLQKSASEYYKLTHRKKHQWKKRRIKHLKKEKPNCWNI